MHGTGTFPFIVAGTQALVELLPAATRQAVEGENHSVPAGVLAAALREFAHAH